MKNITIVFILFLTISCQVHGESVGLKLSSMIQTDQLVTPHTKPPKKYSNYSDDNILIDSEYLDDSIMINLHLPETFTMSADSVKYPLIIIFDSQHEMTYPQIMNSIDLLTNESQMPESIIVGIPFERKDRLYLTSNQKKDGEILSGIEKMEGFLVEELIELMQTNYKANEFVSITGHSRTAFLVNYLSYKHSNIFNASIALSGFYNNAPLGVEKFKTFLKDTIKISEPFKYYFTSGNTLEESTYLNQCLDVMEFLANDENVSSNLMWQFTATKNANHMTNYWVSIPPIFMDIFSEYNSILNNWFYIHLKKDSISDPIQKFNQDIKSVSDSLGFQVNPSLTQIFSLASSYWYGKEDTSTAIKFIKLGLLYYPEYYDFHLVLMEYYLDLKDTKNVKYHKEKYIRIVNSKADLSESERNELLIKVENF